MTHNVYLKDQELAIRSPFVHFQDACRPLCDVRVTLGSFLSGEVGVAGGIELVGGDEGISTRG
jgi:hypothetical protein